MDLVKFYDKYGKEFRCSNNSGKYDSSSFMLGRMWFLTQRLFLTIKVSHKVQNAYYYFIRQSKSFYDHVI